MVRTGIVLGVGLIAAPGALPVQAQESVVAPSGWHKDGSTSSADSIVLIPDSLPEGKVFTLTIHKPASIGSASTRDWFSRQIDKDIVALGTIANNGAIQEQPVFNGLTCAKAVRDSSGRLLIVMYVIPMASNGQVRLCRILSSPESDIAKVYTKQATEIMRPFILRNRSGSVSRETASRGTSSGSRSYATGTASSAIKDRRLAYMTQPGSGLKQSQIEGIYTVGRSRMGVGGFFYVMYEPLIAFKDGTYYDDFDVPPDQFNAAASRELHPRDWGKWRRSGGKFETLSEKKGWEKDNWLGPLKGGSANERLSGTYSSISGGGNVAFGGGTMIASTRSFTFYPDGHFNGGSTASVSSNEPTSNVSVVAGSTKNYDGTYKINGYTVEFRYNDGRVDRRSFLFMDDTKEMVYLNGTVYIMDEKERRHKK